MPEVSNKEQKVQYRFVRLLRGADMTRRRLPLMVVDSNKPGPAVWITACMHGDEVGGVAVVHDIIKLLQKHPLRCGAVYTFPMLNPLGFETVDRHVSMSNEDLNRVFPGSEDGSLGERMAHRILEEIVNVKPTLVMDLHTDWRQSIPYILVDNPTPPVWGDEMQVRLRELAAQTGLLNVLDPVTTTGAGAKLQHTLSYSLIKRGIPALTLELGESYVVNERVVCLGCAAVWRVLTHLGMVDGMAPSFPLSTVPEGMYSYGERPYASVSGLIRFLVEPGEQVRQGKPVARIYNGFGKLRETLRAEASGIVLGHADTSVSYPGKPVFAFAAIQEPDSGTV
jgi:predicted deacylase